MSNIRILFGSIADSAIDCTLTGADFNASYPVTNLRDRRRIFDAVSTAVSTSYAEIKMAWTDAQSVSCLALLRTNLDPLTAKYHIVLYPNSDFTGTPVWDSTVDQAFLAQQGSGDTNDFIVYTPAIYVTVKSISFKVKDTATYSPTRPLTLGRLMVGDYWTPTVGIKYNPEIGVQDTTQLARTAGGSIRANAGSQFRVVKYQFDSLLPAEASQLLAGARAVGKTGEILVALFSGYNTPMEVDGLILGVMPNLPTVVHNYYNSWIASMEVQES